MLGSTQQWTQHPMQARVIHCPFDLQVTDLENFATVHVFHAFKGQRFISFYLLL